MWLDERKSRRVSIKYQGLEISFSGGASSDTIERNMKQFIDLKDQLERKQIQIEVTDPESGDANRGTRPTRSRAARKS